MVSSRWASATLVPVFLGILVAGCGASAPTGPNHTACGRTGQADVVVELQTGKVVDSCVQLPKGSLSGEALMRRSGIEFALQHFSFGDAVCQIDQTPLSYTSCFASGQPYWALYTWSGKGPWKAAIKGISELSFKAGQAVGWHFGTGSPPPPPRPPLAG